MYHVRIVKQGDGGALHEETLPVDHYTTTEVPSGGRPLGGIYREGYTFELTLPPGQDLLAQVGSLAERLRALERMTDDEASAAFDSALAQLDAIAMGGDAVESGARRSGRVLRLPEDGKMVIVMDSGFNTLQTYRWPKGPRRFQRAGESKESGE